MSRGFLKIFQKNMHKKSPREGAKPSRGFFTNARRKEGTAGGKLSLFFPCAAQRGHGLPSCDPVNGQPRRTLKCANGFFCIIPEYAVSASAPVSIPARN
jgi:hypothetical protein